MEAHLIGVTKIDWSKFLRFVDKNILPTGPIKYNEELSFVLALHALSLSDTTPLKDLSSNSLHHDTISLIIATDTKPNNWVMAVKHVSFPDDVNILYGSLLDWREAIIYNLTDRATNEQRMFFGSILLELERHKFGSLWHRFSKQMRKDGTFILEEK